MELYAQDLVKRFGGSLKGINRKIDYPSDIKNAKKGSVTLYTSKRYDQYLKDLNDVVIIAAKEGLSDEVMKNNSIIIADEPVIYFGHVLSLFERKNQDHFVSEMSIVHESCTHDGTVCIHPFVSIGKNTKLGKNVCIHSNVSIGEDVIIGDHTVIFPNVFINHGVSIGDNCIIDSGVKIGSRGFGFPRSANGNNETIPQIGTVQIGNNVYIGANTTVDRGTVGDTFIGDNTKIDNLVQIAHNVHIGKNCLIIAQSGIAGSTIVEDNVIIAAQAGLVDHIKIGKNAIIGAKSGVARSIPEGEFQSGIPAGPHLQEIRKYVILKKLPELYDKIMEVLNERKNGGN